MDLARIGPGFHKLPDSLSHWLSVDKNLNPPKMSNDSRSPEWLAQLDWTGFELAPGATDDQIRAAEEAIGFAIPPVYREFLKVSNGGMFGETVVFYPIDVSSRSLGSSVVELAKITSDPATWPVLEIGHMNFGSDEGFGFRKADLVAARTPCPLVVYWHESGEVDELTASFRDFLIELSKLGTDDEYVAPWLRDSPGPHFPALLYVTTKTRWQRCIIPVPGLRVLYGHHDPPGWAAARRYRVVDCDRRIFFVTYANHRYSFSDTGEQLSDAQLIDLMVSNLRGLRQSPDEFLRAAASTTGDELFRLVYERAVDLPQMSAALHVAGCAFILILCLTAFIVPIALSWWLFVKR